MLTSRYGTALFAVATLLTTPTAVSAAKISQVIIIGMDGLDPDILQRKLEKKELPNFRRLLRGAYMERFESEPPLRSPAVWTTVASGVHRSEHGIWDFVTRSALWPEELRTKYPFRLLTSKDRSTKALWNYTTHAELPAAVINWMVTWPAERIKGYMVAPYTSLRSRVLKTFKGQIKRGSPDQTHPPQLMEEIHSLVTEPESVSTAQLQALGDFTDVERLYGRVPKLEEFHYGAKWTLANTETTTRVAVYIMKKYAPRLVMAYYDGADTLGHRFWVFHESDAMVRRRLKQAGGDLDASSELRRRFHTVIDGYYEIADRSLGQLMKAAASNAVIIVLSDHGFGTWNGVADDEIPYSGAHQKEGVFIIKGPEPGA